MNNIDLQGGIFIAALLAAFIFALCFSFYKHKQYKKSSYYQITKNSYLSIKCSKGSYAEYLTYYSLRHWENQGWKFLFNLVIPTPNNRMTEIDVLLISPKGLFVFECKNFSGWIFGNQAHRNWTQVLPKGRGLSHKEYFYNPIMQNEAHIKHLKNLIGNNIVTWSVIVFSNRCVLKKITVMNKSVDVINLYSINSVVSKICNQATNDIYSQAEISTIYAKLYPYSQLDQATKETHIVNLRKFKLQD